MCYDEREDNSMIVKVMKEKVTVMVHILIILPVTVTIVLLVDDTTGSPVTLILTRQESSYRPAIENVRCKVLKLNAARGVLGVVALLVTSRLRKVHTNTLSNARATSSTRGTVPVQLKVA